MAFDYDSLCNTPDSFFILHKVTKQHGLDPNAEALTRLAPAVGDASEILFSKFPIPSSNSLCVPAGSAVIPRYHGLGRPPPPTHGSSYPPEYIRAQKLSGTDKLSQFYFYKLPRFSSFVASD